MKLDKKYLERLKEWKKEGNEIRKKGKDKRYDLEGIVRIEKINDGKVLMWIKGEIGKKKKIIDIKKLKWNEKGL